MIDFFLRPARVRALLVVGGAALVLAAGLLIGCICLSGKLDAERAWHKATRLERDNAVAEGLRWKAVAEAAEPKITALQGAVRDCLDRETRARADAAARDAIMRQAVPRERTEAEKKGVVDDATRTKAMDRLNRPL